MAAEESLLYRLIRMSLRGGRPPRRSNILPNMEIASGEVQVRPRNDT